MNRIGLQFLGMSAVVLLAGLSQAQAGTNLVQDGNFATLANGTATTATQVATVDNTNNSSGISLGGGWKNDGYTFAFTPGSADTTGSASTEYNHALNLWGPNDGSNNGLTAADTLPGGGGVYLGIDGDYQQGALYQAVSGLTVGAEYYIGFDWAAAQQTPYTGATTQQLLVNIGSGVPAANGSYQFATNSVANPSEGFTPWAHQTFVFTANAASETLSFLSNGTPLGVPPFALLDNVSIVATPEPTTWAMMLAGLLAVGFGGRFWRRAQGPTAAAA